MTVEPAASPTAGAQDDAAIPAAPPQKGPTRYRIYVDAATVGRVEEWCAKQDPPIDHHAVPYAWPQGLGPDDLVLVADQEGHTREAAVGAILDRDAFVTDDRRLAAVQDAERDGVYLDFVLAPVNYLGVVPVATEVKRNRKVGR